MVKFNMKVLLSVVMASSTLSAMLHDTSLPKHEKSEDVKKTNVSSGAELVDFTYDQKNLKDILNDFAQRRSFNIIYSATDTLTSKVTFDAGKKLTIIEAWDFLVMLLDQAGFTLVPHGAHTYMLMANKKAYTESLPLYFNTDYTMLPDNAEKLRYVYYFSSIQLAKQQSEIQSILTTILSSQDVKDAVIYDKDANAIILTAKSEMIKTIMRLLFVFDETGFQEAVEVLPLKYASAKEVATILKSMVDASGAKKPMANMPLGGSKKVHMFSEVASVVDLDSTGKRHLNSVVIMGKTTDVESIKNFIKKYLDIPQQKGKSFYHVVELQWLKAADFANNLKMLTQGGSGQSTGTGTSDLAFDPVTVVTEAAPYKVSGDTSSAGQGGNRLVIAATEKDWNRIEDLIKKVDVPQKQVIIEALVMDLNLSFTRSLASQLRTRGICSAIFPKYMQAQANMLVSSILDENNGDASMLEADLSNILNPDRSEGQPYQVPSAVEPGTSQFQGTGGASVFTIGQSKAQTNGVWGFFQLLSKHTSSKVLTRPVVLAKNTEEASVKSTVSKQIPSSTSGNVSGTVNYSNHEAPISISFKPLISNNDTINLNIKVDLNTYTNPRAETSASNFQRSLTTNVYMKSGDVLILGGLSKERNERQKRSIPFFENIPIIGSLTSSRSKLTFKEQLFILIRPTVVAPRTEGGMGKITQQAVNFMNKELAETEESFSNLKDPITRWFFDENKPRASELLDEKSKTLSLGYSNQGLGENLQITATDDSDQDKALDLKWFSSKGKYKSSSQKTQEMEQIERRLQTITNPFEDRLQL